jgi:hypothetical protein
MEQDELSKALGYIRDNGLVRDAQDLMPFTSSGKIDHVLRYSVTYPIYFPGQKRDLNFNVEWVDGSYVYIGRINAKRNNEDVMQVQLYGMRIK